MRAETRRQIALFRMCRFFCWFALAFGVFLWFAGLGMREVGRAAAETEHWPETTGVVIRSHVEEVVRRRRYRPDIEVRYEVNGREYTTTEIERVPLRSMHRPEERHEVEAVTARFPYGRTVPVYHDPNDPAKAVLVRGSSQYLGDAPMWFGFGLTLAAGLLILALGPTIRTMESRIPLPPERISNTARVAW